MSDENVAQHETVVQVNLGELSRSYDTLIWLTEQQSDGKAPPAALSMALFEVLNAVEPKIKQYNKTLAQLRKTYLNPVVQDGNEVPGLFRKKDAKSDAFDNEFEELNGMTVNLPIRQMSLAALERHGILLSAAQIFLLRWLLRLDVAATYE